MQGIVISLWQSQTRMMMMCANVLRGLEMRVLQLVDMQRLFIIIKTQKRYNVK